MDETSFFRIYMKQSICERGCFFAVKKVLGILRTKIRLLLMIGVLLAAAAGCQFAGEYLHSHYIREEVSETSGNISEKKTVVIDSGHGGKDPGKVGINGRRKRNSICRSQKN